MSVTLAPFAPAQRAALAALRVADAQVPFSGQPEEFLDGNPPGIDLHVIWSDGVPVGMFRIDTDFSREHRFTAPGTHGLRSVILGQQHQGRGIGSATIRALPAFMAQHYPQARILLLTVNLRNPGARKSYLNGGFTDTQAHYLGGDHGPQHILRLDLPPA
ncbi:GNAT family N-acetyltransferase [Salipiger sp. IMCC34102]|uniref:GNAT family N-acetyltransferase n=1 Tax=Salipiger sp. IMCC34102 TaxID=2510647 RepID=UPI00101DBA5F|nr:GNAT family N-acetyltransferase [Salipiger sp. IMCC34102]RYH02363.1 GNAT family N-acetyltransferase [Salipiger sp. IMCC34102]